MKKNILISLIIAIVVFGIFAWSPWISGQYAKKRAVAEFERAWINVADGCGFACHGCGAAAWKKVPFGAQVTLEYACGTQPVDSSDAHQQVGVYVSPLGKVYGLPKP